MRIGKFDRYDMLNNPGATKPAFTIWFAGCTARCPGCHNLILQDKMNGNDHSVDSIVKMVIDGNMSRKYDDIILLGGEPMEQDLGELIELVTVAKYYGFKVWLYTGWEMSDIPKAIVDRCYFIKTGRYMEELKRDGFPASSNQRVFIRNNNRLEERKV